MRIYGFKQEILDVNKNVGVIVVKSAFSKIGVISLVNGELQSMTGYDYSRLKNSNISIIIPNLINETDHNCLIE